MDSWLAARSCGDSVSLVRREREKFYLHEKRAETGLDKLRYAVGTADVAEPVFKCGAHFGRELRLKLEPDGKAGHAEARVIAIGAVERPRAWERQVEGAHHGLIIGGALALLLRLVVRPYGLRTLVVSADGRETWRQECHLKEARALVGQVADVGVHVIYEVDGGLLALECEAWKAYDVESVENDVVQRGARILAARPFEQLLLYDTKNLERDVEHVEQRVATQLAARLVIVILWHSAAVLVQAEIVEGHESAARQKAGR